jgi:hypothetical protein
MKKSINCFIAYSGKQETLETIGQLNQNELVNQVFVLSQSGEEIKGALTLTVTDIFSSESIKTIAANSNKLYSFIALRNTKLQCGQFALERLVQVAENTDAAMVYSNYIENVNGEIQNHPVIDYQQGSLRDDFNFGPVQFYKSDVLRSFSEDNYKVGAYYALRLLASQMGELIRIPEFLFSMEETDTRKSGEKQFDYVSASAREKQIEMELACINHLKQIGAFLNPNFQNTDLDLEDFKVEASVVIPVRDRIKTIKDAIGSVLNQKTNFTFNLIVVDNYSTDGTGEMLKQFSDVNQLIHVIPERKDLGIGGCWNEALFHSECGKFAIQLDSDDLYSDENTLQKIVEKFYEDKCAMVIGSYQMTNFKLEEIPPGIIDHREWTPENGANNALRINGLGAPRAFFTPVLRKIKVPNVSYGEDYAVGLAISRDYKIGRIYDPVYLCRRWDENSDA